MSPSSRRAWIEILRQRKRKGGITVALLAEGVDRNITLPEGVLLEGNVALLAEGVDRNKDGKELTGPKGVALLAEGVDRNCSENA